MGFVKSVKPAAIPDLEMPVSRPAGVLWLLDALLFVAAAALFLWWPSHWWVLGLSALVLSQGLIIAQWKDAKAGTWPNLVVLAVMLWGVV